MTDHGVVPSPSGAGADGPTRETALTVEVDGRHYARQAGGFAPVAAPDVRHVCVVGGDDRECEGEATGCPCGCEASLPPWVRALLAEQRELIGRLTRKVGRLHQLKNRQKDEATRARKAARDAVQGIKKFRALLKLHGSHVPGCDVELGLGPCDCGFTEALGEEAGNDR
jgi:hypothetical protein